MFFFLFAVYSLDLGVKITPGTEKKYCSNAGDLWLRILLSSAVSCRYVSESATATDAREGSFLLNDILLFCIILWRG